LQSRVLQLRPPGSSCGPSSALQATPGARSRVPGVCPDSSSVTSPLSCVCVLYRGYQVGSYKGWPGPAGFRVWPRSSHVRKSGIRGSPVLGAVRCSGFHPPLAQDLLACQPFRHSLSNELADFPQLLGGGTPSGLEVGRERIFAGVIRTIRTYFSVILTNTFFLRGCADRRVANVSMGDEEPT